MSSKGAFIANVCADPFRLMRAFHFKGSARAEPLLEEVKGLHLVQMYTAAQRNVQMWCYLLSDCSAQELPAAVNGLHSQTVFSAPTGQFVVTIATPLAGNLTDSLLNLLFWNL